MNQSSLWVKIMSGALAVVLLSSCAGTRPLGGEAGQGLQVVNATEIPPPSVADTSGPQRPYLLGPSDGILVDVIGVDELKERKFQLDGAGNVSIPLAGTLNAAGQTADQFGQQVALRLRQSYVREPLVSVNLSEARSRYVTIDGQVAKPGNYPVVGKTSLMQAVARARSEEHTSELQSLMRISYAGFCLK